MAKSAVGHRASADHGPCVTGPEILLYEVGKLVTPPYSVRIVSYSTDIPTVDLQRIHKSPRVNAADVTERQTSQSHETTSSYIILIPNLSC
jgi:hypothetical protein